MRISDWSSDVCSSDLLLGDIYIMPIEGGTPTRIAEGLAFEHQPRFSPDGERIAFVSDRTGGDNIWLMNRDGSDKRQISKEDFRLLNQPSWSPDGQFIVAKKNFTTGRSRSEEHKYELQSIIRISNAV